MGAGDEAITPGGQRSTSKMIEKTDWYYVMNGGFGRIDRLENQVAEDYSGLIFTEFCKFGGEICLKI